LQAAGRAVEHKGGGAVEKFNFSRVRLVLLACCCAALLGFVSCREKEISVPSHIEKRAYFARPPLIRVLLVRGRMKGPAVKVGVDGPFEIYELAGAGRASGSSKKLYSGRRLSSQTALAEGGIRIGDKKFSSREIKIVPEKDGAVKFNGGAYRGELRLIANPGGGLHVVNVLDLEGYLWGVIAGEMPTYKFHGEALKCQAVAARTYALWHMKTSGASFYDVTDSPRDSQVYGGMELENKAARRAVDSTRGVILTFEGKIIPAFYHSTCGGSTANIEKLWFYKADEPFKGVRCGYCNSSKYYRWKVKMPVKEIESRLKAQGLEIKKITDIEHFGADAGGHGGFVEIRGSRQTKIVTAAKFRKIINPSELKSSCFTASVAEKGRQVIFEGKGYGHGVGFCQFGAAGLARLGRSYEKILLYYYPGCKIIKIYP